MLHGLLSDPRLYIALARFDDDLADDAQRGGCSCGGRLHRADYPRKPRGGPDEIHPEYLRRRSFCCDRDGCRRRTTPPSVRFLGRRVYLAAVFVLVCAMRHGVNDARWAQIAAWIGASRRTLLRWRQWWLRIFVTSDVWKRLCGRLLPAPDVETLPASWMLRLGPMQEAERLQRVLAWMSPLSTRTPGLGGGLPIGT